MSVEHTEIYIKINVRNLCQTLDKVCLFEFEICYTSRTN